jgi:hypothetical protein
MHHSEGSMDSAFLPQVQIPRILCPLILVFEYLFFANILVMISFLDSSIDYCVLPSKDSQNCENKLVKNDVNGNVIPIVETPSASTSHRFDFLLLLMKNLTYSVHESDNRNYDKTDSTSRHDKDLWRHDPWIRRKFYIVENGFICLPF